MSDIDQHPDWSEDAHQTICELTAENAELSARVAERLEGEKQAAEAKLAEARSDYDRWRADWDSISEHRDEKLKAAEAKLARVAAGCRKWNGLVNTDQERAILQTFREALNPPEKDDE